MQIFCLSDVSTRSVQLTKRDPFLLNLNTKVKLSDSGVTSNKDFVRTLLFTGPFPIVLPKVFKLLLQIWWSTEVPCAAKHAYSFFLNEWMLCSFLTRSLAYIKTCFILQIKEAFEQSVSLSATGYFRWSIFVHLKCMDLNTRTDFWQC